MNKKLLRALEDSITASKMALSLAQELSGVGSEEFESFGKVQEIRSLLQDGEEIAWRLNKELENDPSYD